MTNTKSRIPAFQTVQEEAEFWDTHDFTDYLDELKPVKVKFALMSPVTIRFDQRTLRTLREQAQRKGMGTTTLIRMWVMERLNQLPPAPRRANHSW
jgi:predicted DNA binding CopG/RHH family protein